jgi:uncharacterized protein (DUF1800 family)
VDKSSPLIEHLLRRTGFGVSEADRARFPAGTSYRQIVDWLVAYPDSSDVDAKIGTPGYLLTSSGFAPNTNITHARQRWLFRMVHSPAPLQERMTLLWHHHFATGYNKIAGMYGTTDGARLMAAKGSADPAGQTGQIEMLRRGAFGSFRDLLVNVAQDPAMLVWLDGITNVKAKPQENFARELMELFTFGVGQFAESDVYAAARVFTGWNLARAGASGTGLYRFQYNAALHDTDAKDFTFNIYTPVRHGKPSTRIPARNATSGLQDGLDLIQALAYHPETARRLARRLWTWFISETEPASEAFVESIARVYLDNQTSIRAVLRAMFMSGEFANESRAYQRYAWPAEYVARALREVGYQGFSANDALTPLTNMGQQLFEPPDVNGWDLGLAWFTTGGMLARLNFASQLATNQRVALRDAARPFAGSANALVDFCYDRLSLPPVTLDNQISLVNYALSGGSWTGSDAQLLIKAPGMVHLLAGSAEYQLV